MQNRPAQRYKVLVNFADIGNYEVLRMEESLGGKRLDHAVFMIDPNPSAPAIQNYSLPPEFDDEIEIRAIDGNGQVIATNPVKHWGRVSSITPILTPTGEQWKIVSRAEPFHFGDPVTGYFINDPTLATAPKIEKDIIFNPIIDGTVYGNRNPNFTFGGDDASLFLERDSTLTTAAQTLQGGAPAMWTLAQAIHYLCWMLNPDETHVTNPPFATLPGVFGATTAEVRNVKIKRGLYLPEALDQLLEPVGYFWRMKKFPSLRSLEFVKRGTGGTAVYVNHQPKGQTFDPDLTNVKTSGVAYDGAEVVNTIQIQGAPKQIEGTFELLRAWPESQDDTDADLLQKSHADFDDVKNAYRKWVLNEAGDYIGLRPEIVGALSVTIQSDLNSGGYLEMFPPRRRKFLPTLTQNSEGTSPIGPIRGITVEYQDWDGATWLPIENWGCRVLEKECGIYFDGERVPEILLDLRDDAKIRVTATLEGDQTIRTINTAADSPLGADAKAMLNMEGRFQFREVTSLSQYSGLGNPTLEVDDSAAIAAFASDLVEIWNRVMVSGTVVLEGVDQHQYLPGQRVLGIQHRSVDFTAKQGSGAYPQIVGVTYDVENQQTLLSLEQFRELVV